MTISLIIVHKNTEIVDHYIPIATNGTFHDFWLPPSNELGLKLVPLFLTGSPAIELTPETIPNILEELNQLKELIDSHQSTPDIRYTEEIVIQRITRLMSELNYILENCDNVSEAFIA